MTSWLFVLGESEAVEWVVQNRVMAFRDGIRTNELRPKDRFVVYVSRGAFHNPTRDEAQVVASGIVTSQVESKPVTVCGERFKQSVRIRFDGIPLKARHGVPFVPCVPKLRFIRKKESWGCYVRRSLIRIEDRDYELLADAIAAVKG